MSEEIEVRRNEDGTMDEVCGYGFVHIEQMSATHWWLRIDGKKYAVVVNFHSKARIKERTERDAL